VTGYRILIADDDPMQRELLREYLELSGFAVDEAGDGAQAVERLRGQPADLVILDLQMPVLDGFGALTLLQADPATAGIPALLLTSHDRPNLKVRGLELGAEDYLTKPGNGAELLARVKAALRRSRRYRDRAGALSGDLSSMSLFDLLATLELGGRDAEVEFPDLNARIRLAGGRFVDAGFGVCTGVDALSRIFLASRGRFSVSFTPMEPTPSRSISAPTLSVGALLLDAARRLDEWTREVPELAQPEVWYEAAPGATLPAWITPHLPASAAGLLGRHPQSPEAGLVQLRACLDDGSLVPLVVSTEGRNP
jgi:DNA-binding response OmpR family regulator